MIVWNSKDTLTVNDCIVAYERYGKCAVINDGVVVGFIDEEKGA